MSSQFTCPTCRLSTKLRLLVQVIYFAPDRADSTRDPAASSFLPKHSVHTGLGNSQSEAAAGPTAFAAEISRVPTRSIDGDVRCSRARDQCGRESGLQLLTANHRGGYRRPINDDDGSRNEVAAVHSENSALLHLRKLNRGRREGRDCRGWSGASAQGVYGVAGWEGQQTTKPQSATNARCQPAVPCIDHRTPRG